MDSISLLNLRTAVINEASIDGQTGANGRHTTASLNAMINRYCRDARRLGADAGPPWYQQLGAITTIPAVTANEDFIEIPFPSNALEILGVDVQTSGGSAVKWRGLDPADWTQRRQLNSDFSYPEGGVGWWAIESMPEARDASSASGGLIALFPSTLSGSYRVTYREQFTDMTQDTSLFVGIVPMFTWVINKCVLVLTKRDNNKKGAFAAAQLEVQAAEAAVLKAAQRTRQGGAVTPKRIGGDRL